MWRAIEQNAQDPPQFLHVHNYTQKHMHTCAYTTQNTHVLHIYKTHMYTHMQDIYTYNTHSTYVYTNPYMFINWTHIYIYHTHKIHTCTYTLHTTYMYIYHMQHMHAHRTHVSTQHRWVVCICMYTCVDMHVEATGQQEERAFSSTMWLPGIKLILSLGGKYLYPLRHHIGRPHMFGFRYIFTSFLMLRNT